MRTHKVNILLNKYPEYLLGKKFEHAWAWPTYGFQWLGLRHGETGPLSHIHQFIIHSLPLKTLNQRPQCQPHHSQGQAFSRTAPSAIPKRHQPKPISCPLQTMKSLRPEFSWVQPDFRVILYGPHVHKQHSATWNAETSNQAFL